MEPIVEKAKEISIAIDSWDDIFSDFDPRPLGERVFSEDFLTELKKRYMETRGKKILVAICTPVALKDEKSEKMVIQRLKKDFRQESLARKKEIIQTRIRGFIFIVMGIFSLSLLTLLTYFKLISNLAIELVGIALMPLGWFGIWEGFSKIVDTSPVYFQEEKFFERLSKANYRFYYRGEDLPPSKEETKGAKQ